MRIVLITQDEPFFLAESIAYLVGKLERGVQIVGAVLLRPSPFGKKENFLGKLLRTYRIFGVQFLVHYVSRYLAAKLGRRVTVAEMLARSGVPILRLTSAINSQESLAAIRAFNPDLLVSIAGNEIFRQPLIELAPRGCLNLHSALLPKYRGLMPSFWVLRFRERYTGVSVFQVDEGIDTGPILVQRRFEINGMTQEALIQHSKRIGMDAMADAIGMVLRNNQTRIPNDDGTATYYSFPTAQDVADFRAAGARFY